MLPRVAAAVSVHLCMCLMLGCVAQKHGTVQKVSPLVVAEQQMWVRGEADVNTYRTPLISYTPGGRLLAVVQGRKYSSADIGPKFMVVRRSLDELGDKWDTMKMIVDDGYLTEDGFNTGNIIVDDERGLIFVMYTFCYHHKACNVTSTMLVRSEDDGITWSKPVNVSLQIGTKLFAPGPGIGLQKKLAPHKGRLISCGHGYGVHCLLSDDHGLTWRWGGSLQGRGDECQAVELSDGSIMLNIRNTIRYECDCRIVARSYDGGETFPMKDVHVDKTLIEPSCAAGLLYHRDVLFFSNPNSRVARVDLTLRLSYDNGTSWPGQLPIWDQASGYSTMTAHPGPSPYVFILFEKGVVSSVDSVEFVRISLYDQHN